MQSEENENKMLKGARMNRGMRPAAASEKKKRSSFRSVLNILIVFMFLFLAAIWAAKTDLIHVVFDLVNSEKGSHNVIGNIKTVCNEMCASSAEEIKGREPVYVIDTERFVAPKPDMSRFDNKFESYSDDTIEISYHKERMYSSWFHFMEVRVKHPSQLRMALAHDKFGMRYKQLPTVLSSEVNAVAAVNGSFYNVRRKGVLIYRREVLRYVPFGVDVLLIDSDGNFHFVEDYALYSSGVLDKYDIISGLSFGPELIRDGEVLTITKGDWEPWTCEPRTAICQYPDDLHYLVVLAEGRNNRSNGVTMKIFAKEIAKKGVRNAYNLDGGRSGTMVIGNHRKNIVGWGSEKYQGDILFFATAVGTEEQTE